MEEVFCFIRKKKMYALNSETVQQNQEGGEKLTVTHGRAYTETDRVS